MEEATLIFVQLYDLWKPVGRSPAVTNLKNGGNSCGHVDQQNTDSTVNDLNNWLKAITIAVTPSHAGPSYQMTQMKESKLLEENKVAKEKRRHKFFRTKSQRKWIFQHNFLG